MVRTVERLGQDLRHAVRMARRNPGFAATAILAIALGVGANTAIFSVVNAVLLQPLAYPEADRLVALQRSFPSGDNPGPSTSIPKFTVWRQQTSAFESVAAYDFAGPGLNLTGGDRPEQVKGIHASAGYFDVFRAPVERGRAYTADEDRPSGPNVIVISDALWRSRFAGDPAIVGRTIDVSSDRYQVVGVLGPAFHSDPVVDVWLPLQADPNSTNQGHYLRVTARLRPGVTLPQAQAAMKAAAEQFRARFPDKAMDPKETATAVPLRDTVVSDVRAALFILLGAVGFVLLIACANVANLLLARATLRRREMAIRSALGAGQRRIVAQLLTEAVLLAVCGGGVGLGLGYAGVRWLLALGPSNIPRVGEHGSAVALDWRVLAFTLLMSVVTGVLFGLIPAFSAARSDVSTMIKESGSRTGTGFRQNKARSVLVVAETALALVLLVGAALLIRTFVQLRSVDPGFDGHDVVAMETSLSGTRFAQTAGVAQAVREAETRVGSLPGVEAIASTILLPLEGGVDLPFTIVGQPPKEGPYAGDVQWRDVSPQYFTVFRIPLVRGRALNSQDVAGSEPVVVINDVMAREFWPKGDAVGARVTIGQGLGPEFEDPSRRVVGVVGSARDAGLNADPPGMMFIPVAQAPDGLTALQNRVLPLSWVIRTRGASASLTADIQRELERATGGLPVSHVRTMSQVVGEWTARGDFNTTVLSVFASIALFLAAIGIYGLMAHSVQQRTQEVGIRLALGASPGRVRSMVVRQGLALAGIGAALGIAAALALARVMAGLIYGVRTWDPAVFVSVTLLLGAVAWLACYLPARRASRVNPLVAIRHE